MAHPYLFSANFEIGTNGDFDAETDSTSILDIPHYTTLARYRMAPYRGAYCLRVIANGGTTNAYVQENGSFDFAAAATRFIRWYFYLGSDFVMADTDKFAMFNLESVADTTVEAAAGIDRSGTGIRFWFAETNASTARTTVLGSTTTALNRWYCAELKLLIDSGAPNDGTIDGYIDDYSAGAQLGTLDQGAGVDAKFGIIGPDAGTSGTILMDDIIVDDLQIYRDKERYRPSNVWVHAAQDHPIIGPGKFAAAVTGTGTNAVLRMYDTDGVPTNLEEITIPIRNVSANEMVPGHDLFEVHHGLYVTLTGTDAEAAISIDRGGTLSQGAMISRGVAQRSPKP